MKVTTLSLQYQHQELSDFLAIDYRSIRHPRRTQTFAFKAIDSANLRAK